VSGAQCLIVIMPNDFLFDTGHAYRHDRRYLAIAEQHKGREVLAIYDAGDMYNLIRVG
jgi:hypothetical protein